MQRQHGLKIRRDIGTLVGCVLLLALCCCATCIIPPVAPAQPITVYLCDYGFHSSLLLPLGNGVYVEYLYGDWKWAALGQKGIFNGVRAIFCSDQAALGRRYLIAPSASSVPMPPEAPEITAVVVHSPAERALVTTLDARFDRQKSVTFQQSMAEGGYLYVKDDVHYSMLHDCNSNTAEGLHAMECTVVGLPVLSHFTVK